MTESLLKYTYISLMLILSHQVTAQTTLLINQENSPYYITEDIVIEEASAFIMTEGAQLFIGDNVSIISHGEVTIIGTAENPVEIKPISPVIGWNNIEITSLAENVSIEHASIEDGVLHITDCDVNLQYVDFINHQNSAWDRAILRAFGGSLTIDYCSISSNNKGEGFLCHNIEAPLISNCTFISKPDAVEMLNCSNGRISNCEFTNLLDDAIDLNNCHHILIDSNRIINVADRGMEIGSENFGSSTNIMVHRNVVVDCKEGINFKEGSTGIIENNTIYNNEVGVNVIESKARMEGNEVIVRNCVFDKNSVNIFTDASSVVTTTYCLSTNAVLEGENNITGNPHFTNPLEMDFNLLKASDCINNGDPNTIKDPDGSRADIGAYYLSIIGVNEIGFDELIAWPNPTTGDINIDLPQGQTIPTFYIYGIMGQQELIPSSKSGEYYQFDLSSFSSGAYIIFCDDENRVYRVRVVKY